MDALDLNLKLIFAILNGRVSSLINNRLEQNFLQAGLRLNSEDWSVLLFLSSHEGAIQQEICKEVFLGKVKLTRVINRLERRKLLARQTSKIDRRANTLHLTGEGNQLISKAQKIALLTLKETLKGLGLDELKIGQSVLQRIFHNTSLG